MHCSVSYILYELTMWESFNFYIILLRLPFKSLSVDTAYIVRMHGMKYMMESSMRTSQDFNYVFKCLTFCCSMCSLFNLISISSLVSLWDCTLCNLMSVSPLTSFCFYLGSTWSWWGCSPSLQADWIVEPITPCNLVLVWHPDRSKVGYYKVNTEKCLWVLFPSGSC